MRRPAPRDLPELRGQLAHWVAAEGPGFYLAMALAGCQWIPPGSTSVAAGATQIARQEHQRVVAGDLYWVSEPMTALARHAASRLPTRTLHAHDLPSRSGFMVFEAPLAGYVNDEGREVQIVAVSWGAVGWPRRPVGPGRHLAQLLQPPRPGTARAGVLPAGSRTGRRWPR